MKKQIFLVLLFSFFTYSIHANNYITASSFSWTNNSCPAKYSLELKNNTNYELSKIEYSIIISDKNNELEKTYWIYNPSINPGSKIVIQGHRLQNCKNKNKAESYQFDYENAVLVEN